MDDFSLEKRVSFGNKYLKVFLRDNDLLKEVQELIVGIDIVRNVNITKNKRDDLTVYPIEITSIDELENSVREKLRAYFVENEVEITEIDQKNKDLHSEKESLYHIPRSKPGPLERGLEYLNLTINHFYGCASIFGFIIAFFGITYSDCGWMQSDQKETLADTQSLDERIVGSDTITRNDISESISERKPQGVESLETFVIELEISIQLSSKVKGTKSIEIEGEWANILSTSTPLNPRILVQSKEGMREIRIVSLSNDTCYVKGVFNAKYNENRPIREIASCP